MKNNVIGIVAVSLMCLLIVVVSVIMCAIEEQPSILELRQQNFIRELTAHTNVGQIKWSEKDYICERNGASWFVTYYKNFHFYVGRFSGKIYYCKEGNSCFREKELVDTGIVSNDLLTSIREYREGHKIMDFLRAFYSQSNEEKERKRNER